MDQEVNDTHNTVASLASDTESLAGEGMESMTGIADTSDQQQRDDKGYDAGSELSDSQNASDGSDDTLTSGAAHMLLQLNRADQDIRSNLPPYPCMLSLTSVHHNANPHLVVGIATVMPPAPGNSLNSTSSDVDNDGHTEEAEFKFTKAEFHTAANSYLYGNMNGDRPLLGLRSEETKQLAIWTYFCLKVKDAKSQKSILQPDDDDDDNEDNDEHSRDSDGPPHPPSEDSDFNSPPHPPSEDSASKSQNIPSPTNSIMSDTTNRSGDRVNATIDLADQSSSSLGSVPRLRPNDPTLAVGSSSTDVMNPSGSTSASHGVGDGGLASGFQAGTSRRPGEAEMSSSMNQQRDQIDHSYFYFAYGSDMSEDFLELLCEIETRTQAQLNARRGTAEANVGTKTRSAKGKGIMLPGDEDLDDNADLGVSNSKYALLTSKDWTQDWRKEYQIVGLGKLDNHGWLVDESGEAKIFPSATFAAAAKKNLPRNRAHWRAEDWARHFDAPPSRKPLPGPELTVKWNEKVWQTYFTNPAAFRKPLPLIAGVRHWPAFAWVQYFEKVYPPDSRYLMPLAECGPPEPAKADMVYGIIYRTSPFLFGLLCKRHIALGPGRTLHLVKVWLQDRPADATDWSAPVTNVALFGAMTSVGVGDLTPGEFTKQGREVILNDVSKKLALSNGLADLEEIACVNTSAWMDEVVKPYFPVPEMASESEHDHQSEAIDAAGEN